MRLSTFSGTIFNSIRYQLAAGSHIFEVEKNSKKLSLFESHFDIPIPDMHILYEG